MKHLGVSRRQLFEQVDRPLLRPLPTTRYEMGDWCDDAMAAGHLALPNGLGLDHPEGPGRVRTGVAPNELTASEHRDPWVGTPWHESVEARREAVPAGS
jgi:hypothetical protein